MKRHRPVVGIDNVHDSLVLPRLRADNALAVPPENAVRPDRTARVVVTILPLLELEQPISSRRSQRV